MGRYLRLLIILAFVAPHSASLAAEDEFFEKQVRPLLIKRCYTCHSGTKTSGGLSLETREGWQKGGDSGPAIVPGQPRNSLLVDAINYRSLEMPPPDQGGKMSPKEIAILTQWVQMGAPDPRETANVIGGMSQEQAASWWAWQPIPEPAAPLSPQQIDSILDAAIRQQDLTAAGATDRRTLIRRATYDLTGLPPTPDEVDEFLTEESPHAFDKVIDRLLDSPQYGERWGRHWLDVVRYADTAGENSDRPLPHAWRYRNWVIDSFNEDKPFHEFVRLQLAGDLIRADAQGDARREGIIATGYLAVARRYGHDISKRIYLMHEDVIDNLGKSFLGTTLACARCHDHKYDPVTSEDYYALYGIFNSTKFSFPGCEPRGQPADLVPLLTSTELAAINAEYEKKLKDFQTRHVNPADLSQQIKAAAQKSIQVLASKLVEEGETVSLNSGGEGALDRIALRKGEVLQLTILPNGNYGADTTRLEWQIERIGGDGHDRWDLNNIIPKFLDDGPLIADNGASWCFLNVANGPRFLTDRKSAINDVESLNAWADGENPAVFINKSDQPVSVWTTLPPMTVFCHPGPADPVGVAWICPADGEYRVNGSVADGHPAPGLDGVSFRLERFASGDVGRRLADLAEAESPEAEKKPEKPDIPVAYAVIEMEGKDVALHQRGDPEQPGEMIPRRWLSVFGGEQVAEDGGSGRRQLADWIVASPLFARVIVNRVWHWHFGRGLVATPNDFGSRGASPTHPVLLDLLAAQFRTNGGHLKPLHRLIMKTRAYARSSVTLSQTQQLDPGNQWLARFTRRRLTAEEIRDSLLVAADRLDLTPGSAHPFPPESTWTFTQHAPFNAVYETDRRSVYLMLQRQRRHPYLALFDGADPNSSTDRRETTTVPTQALYFLNDPFFHARAMDVAASVLKSEGDDAELVVEFFRRLYQRRPSQEEQDLATQFLSEYPGHATDRWAAWARILLASNEFLYVD